MNKIIYNGQIIADFDKYILPKASNETLGGIKVGENLTIDENGVLSAGSSSKYSFTKINTEETNAMFKAWRQEILDTGVIPPITSNQGSSYMLYLTDVFVSGSLVNSVVFRFKGRSEATEYNGYRVFYLTVNFNTTTGEVSSYNNAYSTTEYEVIAYGGMSPNPKKALTTDNTNSYTPTSDYHPATKKYVDDSLNNIATDFLNNMQFKNTSDYINAENTFDYTLLQNNFPQGGFLFNENYITVAGVNIQANSIMQVSLWFSQIVITLSSPGEIIQFVVTSDSCTAYRFTGTEITQ